MSEQAWFWLTMVSAIPFVFSVLKILEFLADCSWKRRANKEWRVRNGG